MFQHGVSFPTVMFCDMHLASTSHTCKIFSYFSFFSKKILQSFNLLNFLNVIVLPLELLCSVCWLPEGLDRFITDKCTLLKAYFAGLMGDPSPTVQQAAFSVPPQPTLHPRNQHGAFLPNCDFRSYASCRHT